MVAAASAPAALPDGGRFTALDSLRGVAALGVVAYHVHGGGPLFQSWLARNGWLWVDFFFVLSGFVIAASYGARLAKGFSVTRFMLLRLGRVYPIHAAVLAVYVAMEIALYVFSPEGWSLRQPFAGHRTPLGLLLAALLLHAFRPDGSLIWNGQSWSISAEVWLYLAMALAWRWMGLRAWAVALAAALLALLALALEASRSVPVISVYMLRGLAGFGLGVACWQLWQGGARAPLGGRFATARELCGAGLLLLAIAWPDGGS